MSLKIQTFQCISFLLGLYSFIAALKFSFCVYFAIIIDLFPQYVIISVFEERMVSHPHHQKTV